MKPLVRTAAVAMAGLVTMTGATLAKDVKILVDDAYKPYTFVDENGKITGVYPQVFREIDDKIDKYNIQLEAVPWKRATKMVKMGRDFAVAPPYYTEKRTEWMQYSEKILEEKVVTYCRDEVIDEPRPNWPEDYEGLTVGNNQGFITPGQEFFDMVDAGKINLQEAPNTQLNLRKLIAGRVDCYVNARASIVWNLAMLEQAGKYDPDTTKLVESAVVKANWGYIGFSRKKNPEYKEDFMQTLNAEIKAMKQQGRVREIFDTFLQNAGS